MHKKYALEQYQLWRALWWLSMQGYHLEKPTFFYKKYALIWRKRWQ